MRSSALTRFAAATVAVMAVFAVAPWAVAQSDYKIGVVDVDQVLEGSKLWQAKLKELQGLRDKLQAEVDSLASKIESAQKDFEANASKMSDDERFQKKTQIQADMQTWKAEMDKRQSQVDAEEKKARKEVFDKVDAVLKKVAEAGSFHLIFRAGNLGNPGVVYFSPTVDITSQVLAELNK